MSLDSSLSIKNSNLSGRGFSKFKKNYKLKGQLGSGGFGVVYRAVRTSDETPVAVKYIKRKYVRDWGRVRYFPDHLASGSLISRPEIRHQISALSVCLKLHLEICILKTL